MADDYFTKAEKIKQKVRNLDWEKKIKLLEKDFKDKKFSKEEFLEKKRQVYIDVLDEMSEINQEKLISFYEETFDDISSSEKDYKSKYRFDNGKCEPLIAIKNSKIIGHVGCYPTKFKINNVNHNGVWWSDVFVKKDYRGKGVAQLISKNLMNLSNFHAATGVKPQHTTD